VWLILVPSLQSAGQSQAVTNGCGRGAGAGRGQLAAERNQHSSNAVSCLNGTPAFKCLLVKLDRIS